MSYPELFSIAVGLAADALAVSVCNAMAVANLHLRKACRFGFFFGLFQALMPLLGWCAGKLFAGSVTAVAPWLTFLLLSFIGGKMLVEARQGTECPRENPLQFHVLLLLALATSIDALAVGVSFALDSRISIVTAVAIIGMVTFVLSTFGALVGKKTGNALGSRAESIGGTILVLMGLKILLEHFWG